MFFHFIEKFSRTFKPGKDCFSKDSTGMSNSEIERISNRIKNYLIELYLNGISEEELDYSKNPRRWISTFDKLELETFTVHLPLENGRIMQRKQKIFEQIIPTLMIFKDGNIEATKVGALSKSQLAAFIDSTI